MNNWQGKLHGPFAGMYENFSKASQEASGYDFGLAPRGNVPPPTVKGLTPVTWWSFDRPRRLKAIRRVRDRFLNDILILRNRLQESATSVPLISVPLAEGERNRRRLRKEMDYERPVPQEASKQECARVA
ncbi:MAG: hypothetical protein NPIRA01_22140 [Nitrospirales bacterium]|nr:MAG: hypothetical protein NPIRA01_22140 [Nitrospirales bacterium]